MCFVIEAKQARHKNIANYNIRKIFYLMQIFVFLKESDSVKTRCYGIYLSNADLFVQR